MIPRGACGWRMRLVPWHDQTPPLGSPKSSFRSRVRGELLFGGNACFNRFRDGVGANDLQSRDVRRSTPCGRRRDNGPVEAETPSFPESPLDLANGTKLAG